jgi:hypothetical protein
MNSRHVSFIFIGLLVLLGLGILFGAYEANKVLESHSATLAGLKAANQAATNERTQLAKDKKDIKQYDELNTIARSVVPQDKDQAEAVREIVNLAAESGINQLGSITFPPSTLGGGKNIKTSAGPTQVTPVKGIAGVYDLQITVQQPDNSQVPYNNFTTFLKKLEQNRRTAQVTSIVVKPNPKSPSLVSFTLVIDEFIKP